MGGGKTQLADVAEHLGGISFVYYASSAGKRSLGGIAPAPFVCAFQSTEARISCVYCWKSQIWLLFQNYFQDLAVTAGFHTGSSHWDHIR